MASIRNFNLQGMDLRDPLGDGLMYLQDATITPYMVKERPAIPCKTDSTSSADHTAISQSKNNVVTRAVNYSGTSDQWTYLVMGTGFVDYTSLYPLAGDGTTQVGVNTAFSTTGYYSTCKIGDECFFSGDQSRGSTIMWAGCVNTGVLNSTVSTRTASTTSGSNIVTFSGAVTGLDSTWEGAYIYLSGYPKRAFRVVDYTDSTHIIIDTSVDFTTAGQTWCIQPFGWVGSPDSIFTTSSGASLNEVGGACIESHQSRLFTADVNNGGDTFPHRIWYSGTVADATSSSKGAHYWNAGSYIDAAPGLGDGVRAMQSFGGDLIIFKNRGICVLRGVVANGDPAKYGARVDVLSDEIGCGGPQNVCKTPHGVFLYSSDGVYIVTGSSIDRIDERVRPWILENSSFLNYAQYSAARNVFVMDKKVYVDLNKRLQPGDNGQAPTYTSRNLYLVWDYDLDAWSIRTFTDGESPSGSVTVDYSGSRYTIACPKDTDTGTSRDWQCFNGEEAGTLSYPSGWGTNGNENKGLFCLITNGMASDSPGEYPGYVRAQVVHVLHDTSYTSTEKSRVLSLINYSQSCVTSFDLPVQDSKSMLTVGTDIGDVDYQLSDYSNPPQWERFNVGATSACSMVNVCVGMDNIVGSCTIYGLVVEYQPSYVEAPA